MESLADVQDALYGCRATLHLLCDLFVAKAEHAEILNGDNARLGMFNQLFGLAATLEAIDRRLATLPDLTNDLIHPTAEGEVGMNAVNLDIPVADIIQGQRLRGVHKETVARLIASIKAQGLS